MAEKHGDRRIGSTGQAGSLIEQIRLQFQLAWKSGTTPAIADFLAGSTGREREKLLLELLPIDVEQRALQGKIARDSDYLAALPEDASAIRLYFTSIITCEPSSSVKFVSGSNPPQALRYVENESLPRTFGRYELQAVLGRGGMGSVYKAYDSHLGRTVALKIPKFAGDNQSLLRQRFRQEARSGATLQHPNICQVFDVGDVDSQPYMTMPLVEGETLSKRLQREPFSVAEAARLLLTIARAMGVAHKKGIVHRDLKPANIMLQPCGQPIIMDFGLAQQVSAAADERLTSAGTLLGTPQYMPPEQAVGDRDRIGPASDVYTLGIILFEMITGRTPFQGESGTNLYAKILVMPPPPPSTLNQDVHPHLEGIILKALEKAPEDRYADADLLAKALEDYLAQPLGPGPSLAPFARPGPQGLVPKAGMAASAVAPAHAQNAAALGSFPEAALPKKSRRALSVRRWVIVGTVLALAALVGVLVSLPWLGDQVQPVAKQSNNAGTNAASPATAAEQTGNSVPAAQTPETAPTDDLPQAPSHVESNSAAEGPETEVASETEVTPETESPEQESPNQQTSEDTATAKAGVTEPTVETADPESQRPAADAEPTDSETADPPADAPASASNATESESTAATDAVTEATGVASEATDLGPTGTHPEGTAPADATAPEPNPTESGEQQEMPAERQPDQPDQPQDADHPQAAEPPPENQESNPAPESNSGQAAAESGESPDGSPDQQTPEAGTEPVTVSPSPMPIPDDMPAETDLPDQSDTPAQSNTPAEEMPNGGEASPMEASPLPDPMPAPLPDQMEDGLGLGMQFRLIPAGTFTMGTPESLQDFRAKGMQVTREANIDDEKPPREVTLSKPYYVSTAETTKGQFRQFVEDAQYKTEADRTPNLGMGWISDRNKKPAQSANWEFTGLRDYGDDHPVVNITWNDAIEFCKWLSAKDPQGRAFSLPTEAQWEYACRAGRAGWFHSGNELDNLAQAGNLSDASGKQVWDDRSGHLFENWTDGSGFLAPVRSYQPNRWGLYDMHGNVWEWCKDGYSAQAYALLGNTAADPVFAGPAEKKVLRGGSWFTGAMGSRTSSRESWVPGGCNLFIGFRVVILP